MSGGPYDDGERPSCSYSTPPQPFYVEQNQQPTQGTSSAQAQPSTFPENPNPFLVPSAPTSQVPIKGSNPRETRNKAEKQRRDKMSQSIARLISILPPVALSGRKVDKTSVLRLTAHYIRSHKHVFGDTLCRVQRGPQFGMNFARTFLNNMKGFLMTVTYKGLIVVVSPNIQEYLGYTEVELLGQSFYNMIHPDDHLLLMKQLLPTSCRLTTNGELFLSKEPDAGIRAAEELKKERRSFIVRFKKQTHLRSEPPQYITCHIEGSFRKSDGAGVFVDRVVQTGRRIRSRGNNPYASGNDIVFVGMVRPITDSFLNESKIEGFKMEYRTRHSIDGEIIQCEQRISLITGYMTHEVKGTNAMNFMHRDDVRWVIIALREMYDQRCLSGESCYRLMTKNGEFIYMRTKGNLDVDPKTQEVTSFVCVNTLVSAEEGTKLIQEMKNKFATMEKNEKPKPDIESKLTQKIEKPSIPVEDPRQLEKVICHLVTGLPSSKPEEIVTKDSKQKILIPRLAIIPPKREQIAKAIEKSYSVIKTLRKSETNMDDLMDMNYPSPFLTPPSSPELPREEIVQNQPINEQPEGIPQFFLDNQEFLVNNAADFDWEVPKNLCHVQHIDPMQQMPMCESLYQTSGAFQPFQQAQPFAMTLQMPDPMQPLQQMLEPIDPIFPDQPFQVQQFQEVQPGPLGQEAQLVPLFLEVQPMPPVQEAQSVPPVQEIIAVLPQPHNTAGNNDEDELIRLLEMDTSDQTSFELSPEFFEMLNMTFPENYLLGRAYETSQFLKDTSFETVYYIRKTCCGVHTEIKQSTQDTELIREIESIMKENNILEINPGQDALNGVYVILQSQKDFQLTLLCDENQVADEAQAENQNAPIAPRESSPYDPYRFVDDEEPI